MHPLLSLNARSFHRDEGIDFFAGGVCFPFLRKKRRTNMFQHRYSRRVKTCTEALSSFRGGRFFLSCCCTMYRECILSGRKKPCIFLKRREVMDPKFGTACSSRREHSFLKCCAAWHCLFFHATIRYEVKNKHSSSEGLFHHERGKNLVGQIYIFKLRQETIFFFLVLIFFFGFFSFFWLFVFVILVFCFGFWFWFSRIVFSLHFEIQQHCFFRSKFYFMTDIFLFWRKESIALKNESTLHVYDAKLSTGREWWCFTNKTYNKPITRFVAGAVSSVTESVFYYA